MVMAEFDMADLVMGRNDPEPSDCINSRVAG